MKAFASDLEDSAYSSWSARGRSKVMVARDGQATSIEGLQAFVEFIFVF